MPTAVEQDIGPEEILARVEEVYPEHFTKRMESCLQSAGCPEALETANFLRLLVLSGLNQNQAEAKYPEWAIDDSTFSNRMNTLNLHQYQDTLNAGLRADIKQLMQDYPPEAPVYAIGDGYEKEYTAPPPRKGQRITPAQRRWWRRKSTASNKKYSGCTYYLFQAFTWTYQGHRITVPSMIQILAPWETWSRRHADHFVRSLQGLGYRVDALILDWFYAGRKCRLALSKYGIPVSVRLTYQEGKRRLAYDAETGAELDLVAELEKTALMRELQTHSREYRNGKGQRIVVLERVRVLRVRLESEGPVYKVLLRAALESVPETGGRRFVLDGENSMMVATPPSFSSRRARYVYRVRWRIETLLSVLQEDKPKPRPKNINSEVVQFTAYAYRMVLGSVAQFMLLVKCRSGKFRGRAVERFSIAYLSRRMIGAQITLKPIAAT